MTPSGRGDRVRVIEGRRPVLEILRAGEEIYEILLARGVRDRGALAEILDVAKRRGVAVREVPASVIEDRAEGPVPQGVLALLPPFRYASLDEVFERAGPAPLLTVALDGITDPHNLGALVRSAEAAGAHGVLVPRRRTAPVTPVVEKAAAGALAHLPLAQVDNLARTCERLKERGVWVVALDGAAETTIFDMALASEPLCLVVGAEGSGVSRLVSERADLRVRIPLAGHVSSLNASVAGAVALFEVARRRGPL